MNVIEFDPAQHIQLFADSLEKIRPQDIERLFEQAENEDWATLTAYLNQRPELREVIAEAQKFITADRQELNMERF